MKVSTGTRFRVCPEWGWSWKRGGRGEGRFHGWAGFGAGMMVVLAEWVWMGHDVVRATPAVYFSVPQHTAHQLFSIASKYIQSAYVIELSKVSQEPLLLLLHDNYCSMLNS